jgi:general secretion pathway protein E
MPDSCRVEEMVESSHPPASISDFNPLPDVSSQYPVEYMDANSVIKLREDETGVIVGICDPVNDKLLESLRRFHEVPVTFRSIDRAELSVYLGRQLSATDTERSSGSAPEDERILLDRLANDAPIINLVNSLIIEALRQGASDIHIESFEEDARVRYRIDGVLQTVGRIEREKFPAIASRVKIMANLNIMERRLPQDGRFSVHLGSGSHDVRVSIVPISDGESVVLRLFTTEGLLLSLEDLGLDGQSISLLRKIAAAPHGLILATGPTGSGKTTTLNALIRELSSERVKVITIEDPVEFRIDNVGQIQTHDRIGLTFESLLKRVLRQDPDIIMVGEIRDAATAELALRAALTGHLVLSTLHTNDSISVIARLRNMGIEPYLIAAVLRGVIAQRLVRRVCSVCARRRRPDPKEREILKSRGIPVSGVREGRGCDACRGTGFKGRTPVVELFVPDETVEEMILQGDRTAAIREHIRSKGFADLATNGLRKAVLGDTTIAELQRTVMS